MSACSAGWLELDEAAMVGSEWCVAVWTHFGYWKEQASMKGRGVLFVTTPIEGSLHEHVMMIIPLHQLLPRVSNAPS